MKNLVKKEDIFIVLSSFLLIIAALYKIFKKEVKTDIPVVDNSEKPQPAQNKTIEPVSSEKCPLILKYKIDEEKLKKNQVCIIRFDKGNRQLRAIKRKNFEISVQENFVKFKFEGHEFLFILELDTNNNKVIFSKALEINSDLELVFLYDNGILKHSLESHEYSQMQKSNYAGLYQLEAEKDVFHGLFEKNMSESSCKGIASIELPVKLPAIINKNSPANANVPGQT